MSFDMESSVTYTFQEPFSVMQNRSSQASSVSTESSSRAREDVAFSFATSQRPAMLLTVSTFSQQYIAVILAKNGTRTPAMLKKVPPVVLRSFLGFFLSFFFFLLFGVLPKKLFDFLEYRRFSPMFAASGEDAWFYNRATIF